MSIISIPAECYTCPYINLCEKNKNGESYIMSKEELDSISKPRKSKHSNGDQFSSLLSKI